MDHAVESPWLDHRTRLQELIRMRQLIQTDKKAINTLTQYILEHESSLHDSAYLEELLLAIDGPDMVQTGEEYCKILYRIVSRTNGDLESNLSFRASVNLQLLRFWAQQRGWSK